MIYVIVKESGSYSDYGMEMLFAYTYRPTAEAKLKELEGMQEPAKQANEELRAAYQQIDKEHPFPFGMQPKTLFKSEDPAWIRYAKLAREHGDKTGALRKQEKEHIAAKHNITVDDCHYGYDDCSLSIEEVEGY